MHNGDDTAYYLKKGYKVIAVEANPTFFNFNQAQFADEVNKGQLVILSSALVPSDYGQPTITLHIDPDHLDWSSLESGRAKSYSQHVTVNCMTLKSLYLQFGIPEYMKMDIEATEYTILEDIHKQDLARPKYISVEASDKRSLPMLKKLGYSLFKWSNQNKRDWKCYFPSKHKQYFQPQRWTDCCSGPWGEDLAGEWMDYEAIQRVYEIETGKKSYWADIHAKLS